LISTGHKILCPYEFHISFVQESISANSHPIASSEWIFRFAHFIHIRNDGFFQNIENSLFGFILEKLVFFPQNRYNFLKAFSFLYVLWQTKIREDNSKEAFLRL